MTVETLVVLTMNTLNHLMGPLSILLGYLIATCNKWTSFYLVIGFLVLVTANTFWQIEVVHKSAQVNLSSICVYVFLIAATALSIRFLTDNK